MLKYLVFLLISACGFQPIYSEKFAINTSHLLSSVKLEPISEESGNKLHLKLSQALNPTRIVVPTKYKLHITLNNSLLPFAIVTNSQILKQIAITNISYKLIDSQTSVELLNSNITSSSSYYTTPSEFATFTSEQMAIENNFKLIAEELRNKLIVFFTNIQKSNSNISKLE